MLVRILAMALALTASVTLHAANIFNVTGPSPFGITGELADVLSFTLTSTYSNVTITVPLEDTTTGGPIGGVEGTAYVTNQIGPGTTVANQAALPVSISGLSATFTNRTLFSGLTLTPGTYYIVLARTTTNSLVVQGSSTPTVTLGSGVVDRGEGIAFSLAAYPPASGFIPSPVLQVPTNIFISITGDLAAPSAIPATSPLVLLLTGLAVVGLFTARHKFARRGKLTR